MECGKDRAKGAAGGFASRNLVPGRYTLGIRPANHANLGTAFNPAGGQEFDLGKLLLTKPTGSGTGIVRDTVSDEPPPNCLTATRPCSPKPYPQGSPPAQPLGLWHGLGCRCHPSATLKPAQPGGTSINPFRPRFDKPNANGTY